MILIPGDSKEALVEELSQKPLVRLSILLALFRLINYLTGRYPSFLHGI
jgi:hypothetical protein